MVKIVANTFLESHVTNSDGDKLRMEILKHLKNDCPVVVSFKGIYGLNSSFINSAFIDLLEDYSFDYIKKNLSFIESNKQINNMILSRFNFEIKKSSTLHHAYC